MESLSPKELKNWIEENKPFQLIDVREDWERSAFHIGGEHIPLSEIISRKGELEKDKPVVFYCEKGIRSTIIIQRLEASGFQNLYNLTGGMAEWKKNLV